MDLLQRISSFVLVPNLTAALIGFPSALLYLLEVFIVWACRGQQQFNSSFFHLFIVRALPVSVFKFFNKTNALLEHLQHVDQLLGPQVWPTQLVLPTLSTNAKMAVQLLLLHLLLHLPCREPCNDDASAEQIYIHPFRSFI